MKKGFMLIELLIAILITSMISILLLTALQQTSKFQAVIDNNIDMYTRAIIFHHQLEKDIMGAFVPIQADKQPTDDKKQKKPLLERVFYSTNRDKQLDTLTFITTNPLAVYWGEKTGSAKPRAARVVYQLQSESEKKESFAFLRQEGSELSFAQYKKDNPKAPRAYQLIDGIKDLSVTYTIIEDQEDLNKKPSYKTVNIWDWPLKDKQNKKKELPLPKFVTVSLILWDNDYKRDVSFTFTFSILVEAKKEKTAQTQKKSEQQKKTSQAKTNTKMTQNRIQQKSIVHIH